MVNFFHFPEWLDNVFLPQSKKRLNESYQYCVKELQELDVPVCPAQAGVFVWVNFDRVCHHFSSVFSFCHLNVCCMCYRKL